MRIVLITTLALWGCDAAQMAHTSDSEVTSVSPHEFSAPPGAWVGERTASGSAVSGLFDSDMIFTDVDNGELVYARDGSVRGSMSVGGEPTRVVRVGHSVYYTLRSEGRIGYLDISRGRPTVRGTLEVGNEPFDIVALKNLDLLMVSLSQDQAVTTINPYNGQVDSTWHLDGEPRWMEAVDEDGVDVIYVTFWDRPVIARIVPVDDTVDIIELPVKARFTDPSCVQRDMVMRITGGMALDAETGLLYIPSLYMDTELVEEQANSTCSQLTSIVQFPQQAPVPYYAPPAPPIESKRPDRVNPVLLKFNLTTQSFDEAVHLGTLNGPAVNSGTVIRGLPGDVTYAPQEVYDLATGQLRSGGGFVFVPMRNHDHVVVVDMQFPQARTNPDSAFDERHTYPWRVGQGPVEVFVSSEATPTAVSINREARTLDVREILDTNMGDFVEPWHELSSADVEDLPAALMPTSVREGRQMFNSTNDTRMVLPNSGMSCSVCHDEGRSDGLVWKFEDFPRQPPSLAGNLHDTAPYTWTGEVATVEEEIEATGETRMGGSGLSNADKDKLVDYLDSLRGPMRPAHDGSPELLLGEQLFHDSVVACATCHMGDAGVDGLEHQVAGFALATNTPPLRGVGSSAPYFHDGSAASLRDVLERARDGSMGNTGHLTDDEMNALVAYLRTL